jgi:hypothetical protein
VVERQTAIEVVKLSKRKSAIPFPFEVPAPAPAGSSSKQKTCEASACCTAIVTNADWSILATFLFCMKSFAKWVVDDAFLKIGLLGTGDPLPHVPESGDAGGDLREAMPNHFYRG